MINPENNIPLDDSLKSEADDQQSQKDIHSNGLEGSPDVDDEAEIPNTDLLEQAFDASTSSYTLDADKGIAPKKEEEGE